MFMQITNNQRVLVETKCFTCDGTGLVHEGVCAVCEESHLRWPKLSQKCFGCNGTRQCTWGDNVGADCACKTGRVPNVTLDSVVEAAKNDSDDNVYASFVYELNKAPGDDQYGDGLLMWWFDKTPEERLEAACTVLLEAIKLEEDL